MLTLSKLRCATRPQNDGDNVSKAIRTYRYTVPLERYVASSNLLPRLREWHGIPGPHPTWRDTVLKAKPYSAPNLLPPRSALSSASPPQNVCWQLSLPADVRSSSSSEASLGHDVCLHCKDSKRLHRKSEIGICHNVTLASPSCFKVTVEVNVTVDEASNLCWSRNLCLSASIQAS